MTDTRDLALGINVGMAIEQATLACVREVETETAAVCVAEPAQAVQPEEIVTPLVKPRASKVPIPDTARIVAIEFPVFQSGDGVPAVQGRLTMPAQHRHMGRIIVGPEFGLRGLVRPDKFIDTLRTSELMFDPFRMDNTGRITKQGSLINYIPGVRVCPSCGETWKLNHRLNKKAKALGGGKYICERPECVEKRRAKGKTPAELQWKWAPATQVHPDDAVVDMMYNAFMAAEPGLDELALIPRVWGVYPVKYAPTDWVPDPQDHKACLIDARSRAAHNTIRPYKITKAAQLDTVRTGGRNACRGLIVELTCGADGQPGPVAGFMRTSTLMPEGGAESHKLGYKVRLAGHKHKKYKKATAVV